MDSLKNVLKTKRLPADLCGVKFAKDLKRYQATGYDRVVSR